MLTSYHSITPLPIHTILSLISTFCACGNTNQWSTAQPLLLYNGFYIQHKDISDRLTVCNFEICGYLIKRNFVDISHICAVIVT